MQLNNYLERPKPWTNAQLRNLEGNRNIDIINVNEDEKGLQYIEIVMLGVNTVGQLKVTNLRLTEDGSVELDGVKVA